MIHGQPTLQLISQLTCINPDFCCPTTLSLHVCEIALVGQGVRIRRESIMYEKILVALDGSPCAQRALAEAVELAKLSGGVVEALSVVDRGKWPENANTNFASGPETGGVAQDAATAALEDAAKAFRETGVRGHVRAVDAVAENTSAVLARIADECEADLIVIGTHGRRGVQRFLLGSVAESLVRSTDKPVLVVRHDSSEQSQS